MRESQSPKFELERALELKMELAAGRMPKQVAAEDEGMSRGSLCVFVSVSVSVLMCVCVCVCFNDRYRSTTWGLGDDRRSRRRRSCR